MEGSHMQHSHSIVSVPKPMPVREFPMTGCRNALHSEMVRRSPIPSNSHAALMCVKHNCVVYSTQSFRIGERLTP